MTCLPKIGPDIILGKHLEEESRYGQARLYKGQFDFVAKNRVDSLFLLPILASGRSAFYPLPNKYRAPASFNLLTLAQSLDILIL